MGDERGVVETGYDTMADAYLLYIGNIDGEPRTRFLELLQDRLAPGSRIVDIGCGAGVPSTAALAVEHDVLGIDISAEQIRRARENVPAARFEKADVSSVTLPAASVDAVTAFYSLTHVPRVEHETLFGQIAGWLRTGGYLLATLSARGETDGIQDDFVGVPMYFSGHDPATNRQLLERVGFELLVDEVVGMQEPGGSASFQWVLARKVT